MRLLSALIKLSIPFLFVCFIFYKDFFGTTSYLEINQKLSTLEERRLYQTHEPTLKARLLNPAAPSTGNLFKVREVKIEPPKKIVQIVPPIPFVCIGFLKTNETPEFVIEYNGSIYMLHEGGLLLDYQLTSVIAEKGWYKLIFLYKPFNQTQFLMVSDAT